ncbi:BadF/BadG/BcrA/BcrD ATPase family protein [Sulfolobus acidocaldarius]|uniref:Oxidoreductase n=4 Tax=Sulfolobus acidocaldarius TaxID=2285 RepID=Q4JBJ2_SULAC|nr:BadF/BadG/BcrA/BcrD ATPase family protein [Sulfolobus acidocaldarius]AAY79837.1 oxidoreductase [Sulfolobus acidocaldarius DSM 639]AGE70398.1 oxidoreductase [Sulfolobus acidocaldarius N8]AGE72672.1 oxidoreductase [Sulfolobus acidocaldarius Ron12/I]ALU29210.1 ATPase [Sulfolobus acidocaldarius]ALU31937.1 ATPase [Sulfolobus acidocaldarius]
MIIVGIDAGGTKTKAVAYTCDGQYIGEGETGPGNYHNVGLSKAINNIREAALKATKGEEPDVISIGAAGLDSRYDYESFNSLASTVAKKVIVNHDGVIALFAETLGEKGVVVISGTGSVVEGYDGKDFHRIGGRGWLLSDVGSAYWVGRRALRAVLEVMDGLRQKSNLYYKVLEKIRVKDLDDLVLWSYTSSCQADIIASVAEAVNSSALTGDELAISILKEGAEKLANQAVLMARRLNVNTVYMKGGMFKSPIYLATFKNYLSLYGIKGEVGKRNPELGAMVIAFKELGCSIEKLLNG